MKVAIADKPTLDKIARAVGVSDEHKIYGIKINKKDSNPATRCTYLADAVGMTPARLDPANTHTLNYGDWADAWFVKDNFPCMLTSNGSIDYKLDPNNYTLKEDGTASDIADENYQGNAMSAIPLVWLWQYEVGDFKYIYVANYKVNDNYHAYAHQRADGSVADYVFMSIYQGSYESDAEASGVSRVRSLSGTIKGSFSTFNNVLLKAMNNGSPAKIEGEGWYIKTWSQINLLRCLLTLMFCNTDSQACLGYSDSGTPDISGTLNSLGQFAGSKVLRNYKNKAFHQEAIWETAKQMVAGLMYHYGNLYVKMTPPYNGSSVSDFYQIPNTPVAGEGFIDKTLMTQFGDIPIDNKGSSTTYECDTIIYPENSPETYVACVAGGGVGSTGLYSIDLSVSTTFSGNNVYGSLSYLPPLSI